MGDGVNDSEALIEADVGLSLGNKFTASASYCTESDKIEKIVKITIEGKAAQRTAIDVFILISFFCMKRVISMQGLTYIHQNFTGFEYQIREIMN